MPNRFMDLQSKLRTIQNQIESALRTLICLVQRDSLFGNLASILDEIRLFNELISFVLPLSAERIRIRTLLDLIAVECVRSCFHARGIVCLMNFAILGRGKPLLFTVEIKISFGQSDAGNRSQFGIDLQ